METLIAYDAIDTFANYESLKEEAYLMVSNARLSELKATESLLETIEPVAKATTEKVEKTKAAYQAEIAARIAPLA